MATPTRKPPAPPKLPPKEAVAASLTQPKTEDEGQEGTEVDQLRTHLTDAQDAIGEALDLLDRIESEQA